MQPIGRSSFIEKMVESLVRPPVIAAAGLATGPVSANGNMQLHLVVSQQPQTVASGEAQIVAAVVPAAQRKESSPATLELSTGKMNPQAPSWNKRLRIGAAAPSRAPFTNRISAFEKAVRCFADNSSENVITPVPGISFDSLGEAYDFYNLYSWEKGFGIRYGKSRLNVKRTKCIQQQQFDFIMDVFHEDNITP